MEYTSATESNVTTGLGEAGSQYPAFRFATNRELKQDPGADTRTFDS